MKTLTTNLALAAIIAATVIGTLAGCTPQAHTAAPKPTHSSTAVATPKPTTAPVVKAPTAETITVGQELTADETLALKRNYSDLSAAGKVIYTTSAGVNIVVARTQPLPAVVVADAAAKTAAAAQVSASAGDSLNGAVQSQVDSLGSMTSKNLIVVTSVYSSDGSGAPLAWRWIAGTRGAGAHYFGSQSAALAYATDFVAHQADPSVWAVIS
ncbi:hypothetical protein ACVXZ4_08435 [Lacisediminihabitans sp. FW035]